MDTKLCHEAIKHPKETHAFEEASLNELHEPFSAFGRPLWMHLG